MATRGRPRITEEPLTSAERKKRWDQRMRNVEGAELGQPRRTPIVVYLCDEARAVLRQERALARAAELPAVRDSELIEGLLQRHAADTDRQDRPGVSLEELRHRIDMKEAAVQAARTDLAKYVPYPVKRNRRTLLRIADLPRAQPTVPELAQELKRRSNTSSDSMIARLVKDMGPLFMYSMSERELLSKVRRQIEAHIERLFAATG